MGTVIAAVRTNDELCNALKSNASTIFMLAPNIEDIEKQATAAHKAGKMFFIHIDLAEGIGKDEYGIKYAKSHGVDGIISTRTALIKLAKSADMLAVQRFFVLDSQSVDTIAEATKTAKADMIEIMPGTVTKVIAKIKEYTKIPVVAGGLIETKQEIDKAYASGAIAVSTGREELWT